MFTPSSVVKRHGVKFSTCVFFVVCLVCLVCHLCGWFSSRGGLEGEGREGKGCKSVIS